MSSPLVSVIVPCYRQARFLPLALDSALQQTLKEIEIIVVNDGSDDNTDEVCQDYGDKIVYIKQENKGLPAARNAAIAVARGKYLHCLDSDDAIHPEAMEVMVTAMEGREDRLVWVGNQDFEHALTDTHLNHKIPRANSKPFPLLIHECFAPPVTLLSSRKMVNEVGGFNCDLRSCEDWDLWNRLSLAGAELIVVRRILTYYRRHAAAMTRNHRQMLEARTQVLFLLYQELQDRPGLLKLYGCEVLQEAIRRRRRWLVEDSSSPQIAELSRLIIDLDDRGFRLSRNAVRRFTDRRLGAWGDRLALQYFKTFRPEKYQEYTWDPN